MSRLVLKRDFTRFLQEEEEGFPHRVEVYIGDKKLVCSGMIIAQQSSVLEQKIKDEEGILMLDEMVEIGTDCHKLECFKLLYGAPIAFNLDNIETFLKFSSIYLVEDMFTKALKWIKQTINCRSFQLYYNLHKQMCSSYFERFQQIIMEFMKKNADSCGDEIEILLDSNQEIDPNCFVDVLRNYPRNGGSILTKWVSKLEHIPFILEISDTLDYLKLFPDQSDFTVFMSILTQDQESMATMKAALSLQQLYFTNYTKQQSESTDKGSCSKDVPDDRSETKSSSSKAKSSSGKQKSKGKKGSAKKSADKDSQQTNTTDGKKDIKPTNSSEDKVQIELERKIFVGNVPDNVTNEELEKVFSDYGFVIGVDLIPHRKCAFIEFRSVKSSRKILNLINADNNAIKILGTTVYIKPFTLQQPKDEVNANANPEKKVFVGNLPENATVEDLKSAFHHGTPKTVTLVTHRKCAFLEYDDVKTVRKILNMFANGQKFFVLGAQVYVKPFTVQQS